MIWFGLLSFGSIQYPKDTVKYWIARHWATFISPIITHWLQPLPPLAPGRFGQAGCKSGTCHVHLYGPLFKRPRLALHQKASGIRTRNQWRVRCHKAHQYYSIFCSWGIISKDTPLPSFTCFSCSSACMCVCRPWPVVSRPNRPRMDHAQQCAETKH